jgi:hypothetical protein
MSDQKIPNPPKKLWLRGGIIGTIICVVLFGFYIKFYFPLFESEPGLPAWAMTLPLVTGHLYPVLSGFVIPYGLFCPKTEPICTQWNAGYTPNCSRPYTMEGVAGCCMNTLLQPTTACAERSEKIGFFALSSILVIIYFFIGAIIGLWLEKRKSKKIKS